MKRIYGRKTWNRQYLAADAFGVLKALTKE